MMDMNKILMAAGAVITVGITGVPLAHADSGDQPAAEQAVTAIYDQVIPGCTMHHNTADIQSISWSSFYPASWGEGRISDANSALAGPFKVYYQNPRVGPAQDSAAGRAYGQWAVDLEFC
jgi:hypothetical protein